MRNLSFEKANDLKHSIIKQLEWTHLNYNLGINRFIVGMEPFDKFYYLYAIEPYLVSCKVGFEEYIRTKNTHLLDSLNMSPSKENIMKQTQNKPNEFTVYVVTEGFSKVEFLDDFLHANGIKFPVGF